MSDAPRIVLRPNPGITTEQARDARARAWAYVFECFSRRVNQEGSPRPATLDNGTKESKNDCAVTSSIPEPR